MRGWCSSVWRGGRPEKEETITPLLEECSKVGCERDRPPSLTVDQPQPLPLGEGPLPTETFPSWNFHIPLLSTPLAFPGAAVPKEEKESYLFNSQGGGSREPCFVSTPGGKAHMPTCSHPASTYRQSPFPEGTCHHVNLLLASSLLLLARANWPFSSSREHRGGRWQRHLTG